MRDVKQWSYKVPDSSMDLKTEDLKLGIWKGINLSLSLSLSRSFPPCDVCPSIRTSPPFLSPLFSHSSFNAPEAPFCLLSPQRAPYLITDSLTVLAQKVQPEGGSCNPQSIS